MFTPITKKIIYLLCILSIHWTAVASDNTALRIECSPGSLKVEANPNASILLTLESTNSGCGHRFATGAAAMIIASKAPELFAPNDSMASKSSEKPPRQEIMELKLRDGYVFGALQSLDQDGRVWLSSFHVFSDISKKSEILDSLEVSFLNKGLQLSEFEVVVFGETSENKKQFVDAVLFIHKSQTKSLVDLINLRTPDFGDSWSVYSIGSPTSEITNRQLVGGEIVQMNESQGPVDFFWIDSDLMTPGASGALVWTQSQGPWGLSGTVVCRYPSESIGEIQYSGGTLVLSLPFLFQLEKTYLMGAHQLFRLYRENFGAAQDGCNPLGRRRLAGGF